jgi:hypothetical protein
MDPWCKQKAYTFYSGRPLQLAQYHPLPICHECLVVPTYPILFVTCMIYSITVSLCLAEEINYSILFYSSLLRSVRHQHCSILVNLEPAGHGVFHKCLAVLPLLQRTFKAESVKLNLCFESIKLKVFIRCIFSPKF